MKFARDGDLELIEGSKEEVNFFVPEGEKSSLPTKSNPIICASKGDGVFGIT